MRSVFVDSTTLLYSLDRSEPHKRHKCRAWLRTLRATNRLVVNRQVLNEVYSVVGRKPAFAPVRRWIRPVLRTYLVWVRIEDALGDLEAAWVLQDRQPVGFWDALLLAAAARGGCDIFLSEDLNDGQTYDGVRVVNPIRHSPDGASWAGLGATLN